MSKEQISKAIWSLDYHEDAIKRWNLCQSLGKMSQFSKAFHKINDVRNRHIAGAVGAGIGAAFTAGATAGLCATEAAKGAACECNFLAYCIAEGTKRGIFNKPASSGRDIRKAADIPDLQLWDTCKKLMQEEHLAASYAYVKAQHDLFVVRIVSIAVSFASGGGGDDFVDVGLSLPGMPEFFETIGEIKSACSQVEDTIECAQLSSKTDPELLRSFIKRAMDVRRARLS